MIETEWVRCPICGSKTRSKARADTVMRNYPLYCPKCRRESLVDLAGFKVQIVKEPDTQMQSR